MIIDCVADTAASLAPVAINAYPQPDTTVAETFLQGLGGITNFCFQTFDDSEARKQRIGLLEQRFATLTGEERSELTQLTTLKASLVRQYHGTLAQHYPALLDLNRRGAGVFVTVNETDGRGRTKENIVGLRALFVDGDGISAPAKWGLEPNLIVQRDQTHWHAYWLLVPGQPLDGFTAAQQQLIRYYGSDTKVHDLPRVMRVPGFLHRKEEPKALTVLRCQPEPRRTIAEITRAHPVPEAPKAVLRASDVLPIQSIVDPGLLRRAEHYLLSCPVSISGQRGSDPAYWAARVLRYGFNLPHDAAFSLLSEWNRQCRPPWSISELQHKLEDAHEKPFDKPRGWLLAEAQPVSLPSAPPLPASASSCTDLAELLEDEQLLDPPPRVATTWAAVDAALDGGFMPGGVYVLAGLTGNGKTAIATNLARLGAKSGRRVLLLSLEDDRLAVGRRLLAQEAHVAIKALEGYKKPGAVTAAEQAKVEEARGRLRSLPLRVESLVSDLKEVEALIEREVANGTKLVILDQSSWVSVDGAENAYQEASQISRSLKMLAKRLGVVLVVLVQINRGGAAIRANGQDLELHHIRDTGRWEQDADGVLIIQRIDDTSDPALMTVDLKKHRHGPKEQRITLAFTLRTGLIEDDRKALKPVKIDRPTGAATKGATGTARTITTEAFVAKFVAPFPKLRDEIAVDAEKQGIKAYKVKELLKQAAAVGLAEAVEMGPNKERGYRLANARPVAPVMPSAPAMSA